MVTFRGHRSFFTSYSTGHVNVEKSTLATRGGYRFKLTHALRERLRTHKVLTKDRCFYLNYHKFSIKSYVLDVY